MRGLFFYAFIFLGRILHAAITVWLDVVMSGNTSITKYLSIVIALQRHALLSNLFPGKTKRQCCGLTMPGYEVKFETFTIGGFDYRIRSLLDRQQYCDRDGEAERLGIPAAMWPIFGMVWPAGLFLAETMAEFQLHGRRILEIGCGIGLASLVLQRRYADITSTDLHPLAQSFLTENLILNQMTVLPFHRCSWSQTLPELGRFDLIIGSDLLYEPEHPQLLAGFIDRHATAKVEVIIVDPGRGNHGKFNQAMLRLGFQQKREWSDLQQIKTVMKKGHLLNYHRTP